MDAREAIATASWPLHAPFPALEVLDLRCQGRELLGNQENKVNRKTGQILSNPDFSRCIWNSSKNWGVSCSVVIFHIKDCESPSSSFICHTCWHFLAVWTCFCENPSHVFVGSQPLVPWPRGSASPWVVALPVLLDLAPSHTVWRNQCHILQHWVGGVQGVLYLLMSMWLFFLKNPVALLVLLNAMSMSLCANQFLSAVGRRFANASMAF